MAQNCRPINRAQAGRAHFPKKKVKAFNHSDTHTWEMRYD